MGMGVSSKWIVSNFSRAYRTQKADSIELANGTNFNEAAAVAVVAAGATGGSDILW